MGFFPREALAAFRSDEASADDMAILTNKLAELHSQIETQLQTNNLDLHILASETLVSSSSVSTTETSDVLCVQYLRSKAQAVIVERLMGREEVASVYAVETHRHPTLEIRLSRSHFVVELLLAPDAWWDQQNFVGKVSITRHRQEFYTLLRTLEGDYCTGFWQGTHQSDMHLTTAQFQHPRIMEEWMQTFEPNLDWFRVGIWYDFDDDVLASAETLTDELSQQLRTLYALYDYILWRGDNNYREFYNRD